MAQVALIGGDYQARSLIANAQRCCDLYGEQNPPDAPFPFTYYARPGLRYLTNGIGPVRCAYRASNGGLYAVIGSGVWYISETWAMTGLGIVSSTSGPCYMTDNGLQLLLVDGTESGWTITLGPPPVWNGPLIDPAFYGGVRVGVLDGFILIQKPNTQQFYTTSALTITPFNPLYFANKNAFPDNLMALVIVHREIWLLGSVTSEIYYNSGASDFPFERMPGAIIEYGCVASASAAEIDAAVLFLSRSKDGACIVMEGANYRVKRVSTHALEAEFAKYATTSDAIGMCFQMMGHTFYLLAFPAQDITWCYDRATGQWAQWRHIDENGVEHRHSANCVAYAHGTVVCGDWENGIIYAVDPNALDDSGTPIEWLRTFPHMQQEGKRVVYDRFILDMQCGTLPDSTTDKPPRASLRWSNDRGASWGNPIQMSMGSGGQTGTNMSARRLGQGRHRVFEASGTLVAQTALNGAYVETRTCAS